MSKPGISKKTLITAGVSGLVGLVLGGALFAGGGDGVAAEPAAPVTVRVTETPEPAPAVTVTAAPVTKTEVPDYCLNALDDAEAIFTLNAELMNMWGEHTQRDSALFTEMSTGDFSGMDSYIGHLEAQTTRVNEITDELTRSPFNLNKGLCREEAGVS